MYATGFLQEQRRSPVSLAAVVGLHAAAFALLVLYGTTTFQREDGDPAHGDQHHAIPADPPREPAASAARGRAQQVEHRRRSRRPSCRRSRRPIVATGRRRRRPTSRRRRRSARAPNVPTPTRPVIPEIIRRGAEVDPRFRDALQPPYPREQEAAQREGRVRVRITIGTDGRVTAIEQVASTNDSFWRVTQRQALSRWRFRPATVDGRPVVSTMVFTVTFRLPEA